MYHISQYSKKYPDVCVCARAQ